MSWGLVCPAFCSPVSSPNLKIPSRFFCHFSSLCLVISCRNLCNVRTRSIMFRNRVTKFSQSNFSNFISRAAAAVAEYKFPDPIPEFADAETEKFKNHLLKKLPKKDIYGDSVQEIVRVCTEIFNTFLHTEYGGPGTLMVEPFIDMADTLNEQKLPGGPQAARTAIKWAQAHVDKDWNEWTGDDN